MHCPHILPDFHIVSAWDLRDPERPQVVSVKLSREKYEALLRVNSGFYRPMLFIEKGK